MKYLIARNKDGKTQSLKNHTIMTANIATSKIYNPLVKKCVEVAAMLHDMGKASDRFQKKILGANLRTRHAFLGAESLSEIKNNKYIESIQYMIEGHHSGLKDPEDYDHNIQTAFDEFDNDYLKLKSFIEIFFKHTGLEKEIYEKIQDIVKIDKPESNLDIDVITRLGISAIKDGDTTDAHSFENGSEPEPKLFNIPYYINTLNKYYETLKNKSDTASLVNILRNKAKDEVFNYFNRGIGFFTLNLPTGLGKTLLSIYWALHHARFNRLRRIIYVLPFNTISDQVGDILIKIFGEDDVLIDHSGVSKPEEDSPYFVEKWDAPIIVTSSVQFFETLFSHKSKKISKYHNIQRSVVIFDEFQTFPKDLMEPTNIMLKTVQKYLECSFLYSTATMPWVESTYKMVGIDNTIPIISDTESYYSQLIRVKWERWKEAISLEELSKRIISENGSVLCIVNTKKNAYAVYKFLLKKKSKKMNVFHLSGNMLYEDRKKVLNKVKELLNKGECVKLISTQLVEAGVDIDFPVVYRTEAPFEALIQSAGRCNREGKLDKGKMVIVKLIEKDFVDSEYNEQKSRTLYHLYSGNGEEIDVSKLTSFGGYKEYSKKILNSSVKQLNYITDARKELKFKTVGGLYQLIPDSALKVYIYVGKKRCALMDTLLLKMKENQKIEKKDWKILHRNSISLFRREVEKHVMNGTIKKIVVGEAPNRDGGEPYEEAIYCWVGQYNAKVGIVNPK